MDSICPAAAEFGGKLNIPRASSTHFARKSGLSNHYNFGFQPSLLFTSFFTSRDQILDGESNADFYIFMENRPLLKKQCIIFDRVSSSHCIWIASHYKILIFYRIFLNTGKPFHDGDYLTVLILPLCSQ